MKGIEINDNFVGRVLDFVKPQGKVTESKPVEKEVKKVNEEKVEEAEAEEHTCPLCESKLETAIPKERLEEHVDLILNIINENFEVDGESLDEDTETEDESEETEEENNDSEQN